MHRFLFFTLITTVLGTQSGCNGSNPVAQAGKSIGTEQKSPEKSTQATTKPISPLQLSTPPALPEQLQGKNLSKLEAEELLSLANQAMNKGDYTSATTYQYWYVKKAMRGQYNLACFLAQIKQVDPAFYWLQKAAAEEGVDSQHANQDEDLVSLRSDSRWPKVSQYLADYNRFYEQTPIRRYALVVPTGYQAGTPIPVVIWLHGLGSEPEDFVNSNCQELADALKVAFLGVSATYSRGPHSFAWSTNPALDADRIKEALKVCTDKLTPKSGQLITLGFSQGAQAGLEVAVRSPDQYAGAIVLSPGGYPSRLQGVSASPILARRGYVLCCGAQEHPGNVALTAQDATWLQQAKAKTQHKAYQGVSTHSLPDDFYERFPEWVQFILKAQKE